MTESKAGGESTTRPQLSIHGVSRSFGGVYASRDVSMSVATGELRGVIGPNGAGKSTLLSLISGHLRAQQGLITMSGTDITRMPAHRRAGRGIATVFQGARLFRGMTVFENVMVGAHAATRAGLADALLRTPRLRRDERNIRARAEAALERVGLENWADREAEDLPIGQQRHVQIARALAATPTVLLLDEPASGLRQEERERFSILIQGLKQDGTTIVLIEHDVAMVTRLADRITVLELGQVIADGPPDEVSRDPRVIKAYLGGDVADVAHN